MGQLGEEFNACKPLLECVDVANYHSLSSYPWGFTKNGTYCRGGTQGYVFSQPFSHFFRPTTTVFEGFKFPLAAKGIIQFLIFC